MVLKGLLVLVVLVAVVTVSFLAVSVTQSEKNIAASLEAVTESEDQTSLLNTEIRDLKIGIDILELKLEKATRWLFTEELRIGSRGGEVETLQTFLAQFPEIYPEGLITGFFGPLTGRAVRRFQEQHNITTSSSPSFGRLGTSTRKVIINELIKVSNSEVEAIASGIPTASTTVIANTATTTEENVNKPGSPVITIIGNNPSTLNIGVSYQDLGATVTDDLDDNLGIHTELDGVEVTGIVIDTSKIGSYTITYFSVDQEGNRGEADRVVNITGPNTTTSTATIPATPATPATGSGSGTTSATPATPATTTTASDTTAPVVSSVQTTPAATSTLVSWTTSEAASGQVFYSSSSNVASLSSSVSYTAKYNDVGGVTTHEILIVGLLPETTYYYLAVSTDTNGDTATSSESSFITTASTGAPDEIAPNIVNVSASDPDTSSTIISWYTNETGDTQVEYGLNSSYGSSSSLDSSFVYSHSVSLLGLQSNTLYHYRVKSKDFSGNLAVSEDNTFTTDSSGPSLVVLSPVDEQSFTPGGDISISWQSTNAPSEAVVQLAYATCNDGSCGSYWIQQAQEFGTDGNFTFTGISTSGQWFIIVDLRSKSGVGSYTLEKKKVPITIE